MTNPNPLSIEEFIDVETFVTEIDEKLEDLNEAMRTLPARTAFYGMKYAQAKTQAARIDNIIKATAAMLKKEHREALTKAALEIAEADGTKPERVTAEMVEAAVYTDPRMVKLMAIQLHAEEVKSICQVAQDAFRTRRDMVKSLGHLATEQMRQNLRFTAPEANAVQGYQARRRQREAGQSSPTE